MKYWKIAKGDRSTYSLKMISTGKEQPKDNYGNVRFHYVVQNVLSGETLVFDASSAVHKQISCFRVGEVFDIHSIDIGAGKSTYEACLSKDNGNPPAPPQSAPPQTGSTVLPPSKALTGTKDERIEKMFNTKTDNINVALACKLALQSISEKDDERIKKMFNTKTGNINVALACKLALQSLSEKDKERTFSELKVLLPERERYFLSRLETELRAEMTEEKMQGGESKPDAGDNPLPF